MDNRPIGVLDSGSAIARQVKKVLQNNNIFSKSEKSICAFYTTGEKNKFSEILVSIRYNMANIEKILL